MKSNRKSAEEIIAESPLGQPAESPEQLTELLGTAVLGAAAFGAVKRLISAGREREAADVLLKEFLKTAAGSRREDLQTGREGLFKGGRTTNKVQLRNLDLTNVKVSTSGGKTFKIEWDLEGEFEGKLSEIEKVISAEARKIVTFDRKLEGA